VKKRTIQFMLFLVFLSANAMSQQTKEYALFQTLTSGSRAVEASLSPDTVPANRSRAVNGILKLVI
jgi:hypothetical protein